MAGNREAEELLRIHAPHTLNALQHLVMVMADAENSAGKKTFFGRDKGQEAYAKFLVTLKKTIHCLMLDGVTYEADTAEQVLGMLEEVLIQFASAYPNWPDAYRYGDRFIHPSNRPNALAMVERLRGVP